MLTVFKIQGDKVTIIFYILFNISKTKRDIKLKFCKYFLRTLTFLRSTWFFILTSGVTVGCNIAIFVKKISTPLEKINFEYVFIFFEQFRTKN